MIGNLRKSIKLAGNDWSRRMNDLTFTDKGFADYIYWQFQDKNH